jgi:CHAD domain-containing protein
MPPRTNSEDIFRKRWQALSRTVPRALAGDPRAVHKSRVASRRVREALPIALASAPPKKRRKLRTRIESVTRALGPVRELDVSIRLIEELAAEAPETASALERLRLDLQTERQAQHEEMLERLEDLDLQRLRSRAERLAAGVGDEPADGLPGTAVLLVRLTRRVEELEAAVEAAGPLYAPEPIHAVRIAVKKLRYAFELSRDLRLLASRGVLPRLRAMQETLGRLHDLQVLASRVEACRSQMPPSGPRAAALGAITARLEAECRELHARFLARRDKLVAAVDQAHSETASRVSARNDLPAPRETVH